MASAAALKQEPDPGTAIPGEGQDTDLDTGQSGERDFEAEAREHGWRPKEEFPGDPTRWVDAETFMKRADEMMPLLKAKLARVERDYASLKKDLKRATAHFEGAEKRAYERAKADLTREVEEAIETGDLEAGRAAMKKLESLAPEATELKSPVTKEDVDAAYETFRDDHPWYDRGNLGGASEVEINARLYADRLMDRKSREFKRGDEPPPDEFFASIAEEVFAKYPALNGKQPRSKPASAVEAATGGRGSGRGKSWDSLPASAKAQYSRFIEKGIGIKNTGDKDKDIAAARAYYAKTHDWEGFQE